MVAFAAASLSFVGASGIAAAGVKVTVCHTPPGNPDNFFDILVSENALAAHLAHGDFIG